MGEKIGLIGSELREFVREQQAIARDKREKTRRHELEMLMAEKERAEKEREEKEKDRQFELERLKWVENTKRMELQAKSEESMNRSHVIGDDGDEHEIGGPDCVFVPHREQKIRGPKMAPLMKGMTWGPTSIGSSDLLNYRDGEKRIGLYIYQHC